MMRKILLVLFLAFFLIIPRVWAAGTVAQTFETIASNVYLLTYSVTADASDGSVPATASVPAIDGYVFLVVTDPGATAPTGDYDITLTDSNSVDIMGGELGNRSATASEQAVPKIDAVYGSRWVDGILTLNITNNSVNSALIVVKVFVYR